jgi:hypothetical protein
MCFIQLYNSCPLGLPTSRESKISFDEKLWRSQDLCRKARYKMYGIHQTKIYRLCGRTYSQFHQNSSCNLIGNY